MPPPTTTARAHVFIRCRPPPAGARRQPRPVYRVATRGRHRLAHPPGPGVSFRSILRVPRTGSPHPRDTRRRYAAMSETLGGLKLGQKVPDFELTTYDPVKGGFGEFRLQDQLANKRWTILFFYPADFTFV